MFEAMLQVSDLYLGQLRWNFNLEGNLQNTVLNVYLNIPSVSINKTNASNKTRIYEVSEIKYPILFRKTD